jgi:hypothetical protein
MLSPTRKLALLRVALPHLDRQLCGSVHRQHLFRTGLLARCRRWLFALVGEQNAREHQHSQPKQSAKIGTR